MQLLSSQSYKRLFYLMIISLAISLSIFTSPIDNRNFFLIGIMCIGPLIILTSKTFIPKIDIPLICLMVYSVVSQFIFYPTTFRASTVFFSCMFYCYFMALIRVFIKSNMRVNQFLNVLEILIYAYAIVLVIQQLCVLTGLPVINKISDFYTINPWKLNSLSAEPSHTSRYVGLLMFTILVLQDKINSHRLSFYKSVKQNKWIWISFFWIMLTTQSGTAILVVFLIICKFIRLRNIITVAIISISALGIGIAYDFTPVKRVTAFLDAVTTINPQKIIEADASAAVRIVPDIMCISNIDASSPDAWLVGDGIDSSKKWLYKYVRYMGDANYGGLGKYLLEYGLLCGILYIAFAMFNCLSKKYLISTLGFILICVILNGINSQIAWLCISLLFLSKYITISKDKCCKLKIQYILLKA